MDGWISVTEKLPLNDQVVVVTMLYKGERVLRLSVYSKAEWEKVKRRGGIITHWLFIPELPMATVH